MAVLVEGIAIVVSRKRLMEYLPGGEDAFCALAGAGLVAGDENLLSASFPMGDQASAMGTKLMEKRLPGSTIRLGFDFAVVDQVLGVELRLPWLEFTVRHSPKHGGPISAVALLANENALVDWDSELISVPPRWARPATTTFLKKYEARGLLDITPSGALYREDLADSRGTAGDRSGHSDPETTRAMLHEALVLGSTTPHGLLEALNSPPALVVCSVVGMVVGASQGGALGSLTGLAAVFFCSVGLRQIEIGIVESSFWQKGTTRVSGVITLVTVPTGVWLFGWRWGWLGAICGALGSVVLNRWRILFGQWQSSRSEKASS